MRVHLCSDLHLEFGDLTLPGGDVLILSGDIVEAKRVKNTDYTPEIIALSERTGMKHYRYMQFFNEECAKYKDVIYVMGNHEHYHGRFDKTQNQLKENLPGNIHVLEKESLELNGVLFVGTTLWTNCNNADPLTINTLKFGMNDYKVIQNYYPDKNLYHKLIPEFTYSEHLKATRFISKTAMENLDKRIVVVTHHAPSRRSIGQGFEGDYHMNGGYASDLDEFIADHPNIKVWTHGHVHNKFDYQIEQCRVLCNPRGYYGHESIAHEFDPTFGFDI
jgi:Icc-related predicted phosphoesterase